MCLVIYQSVNSIKKPKHTKFKVRSSKIHNNEKHCIEILCVLTAMIFCKGVQVTMSQPFHRGFQKERHQFHVKQDVLTKSQLLENSKETEAGEELQTGSSFLLENPLRLQKNIIAHARPSIFSHRNLTVFPAFSNISCVISIPSCVF